MAEHPWSPAAGRRLRGAVLHRWQQREGDDEAGGERRATALDFFAANWRTIAAHVALWAALSVAALLLLVAAYVLLYSMYVPAERIAVPVYFRFPRRAPDGEASLREALLQVLTAPAAVPHRPPLRDAGPIWAAVAVDGLAASITYDVSLQLLVPDMDGLSERLGNVMVCTTISRVAPQGGEETTSLLNDHNYATDARPPERAVIAQSARPTLLSYQSRPLRAALAAARLPLAIFGLAREATMHRVFLFKELALPPPVADGSPKKTGGPRLVVSIEVDNAALPIYEASLHFVAHFGGLRYAMHYWRYSFAAAAIGGAFAAALALISLAVLVSLYNRLSARGGGEDAAEASDGSHDSSGPAASGDDAARSSARRAEAHAEKAAGPLDDEALTALNDGYVRRRRVGDRAVPDGSTNDDADIGGM